jgi:tetratricopeptide (TPR) repeat protein
MEKKDLAGVREILYQAEQKFPLNKDPYKFQAICIVQGVISDIVDIDNPKKKQAIIEAKVIIDRAIEKCPKDLNLLYLRGLLLFYMHNFYEALIDLDAVIDLEEEATAKHYVARGRCHACLSMFQEAIADLSKAIELDEEIADVSFIIIHKFKRLTLIEENVHTF